MRRLLTFAASMLAAFVLATTARADPIGTPENPCGNNSCFGNIFTLTYVETGTNTFRVTLTVDTSAYSGQGTFLSDLSLKVVPQIGDLQSYSLASAPGGAYSLTTGNLNARGCGGSGGGFLCVSTSDSTAAPVPGGTYAFAFDLTLFDPSDLLLSSASIQARYGINGNLTSEGITIQPGEDTDLDVPEPGTLLLIGAATLAAGAFRRRRA